MTSAPHSHHRATILRRFADDARGSIAVLSALFAVVVMALAALAIDTGKVFVDRRKAQSVADLAALAAVSDLPNATRAAAATAARNGAGGVPLTVELGRYRADPALPPSQRFAPIAVGVNAARVTLRTSSSLTFGAALIGRGSFDVTTQAIATQSAFATFAIGSRLAQLNGGLLNRLLGALLGTTIDLSVADYQALLRADLDLFGVMSALATRIELTGASYGALLAGNVKAVDVLNAMTDAARAGGASSAAVAALDAMARRLGGSPARVALRSVLDAGVYDSLTIGERPRVSAAVSALDMLMALAQIANGASQVDAGLDLAVPGIVGASLALVVGERPQGRSWVTVGAAGASVHTAQMRLLLNAQVLGAGAIASINLPVYLELAAATATLESLACGRPDPATASVTLNVTPALVDAWIGQVPPAAFANLGTPVNPPAATLANVLGLVTATARAHVAVTNMAPTPVSFSMSEIAARTRKTVGTTDIAHSLLSSLIGKTELKVTLLGLNALLPDTVTPLLRTALANAVTPLDQLLAAVLGTLGVGLGQADVWVAGLRCDGAVLVN